MKKIPFLLSAVFCATILLGQNKNESKAENTIETIKIINGDTVMHDVRIVEGDLRRESRHGQVHMRHKKEEGVEFSDDIKELLEEIEVYVNLDDHKKEMIFKRLSHDDEDMELIIENWVIEDDMVIDMTDDKKVVKIIKIEIDKESGKEVKSIDKKERKKDKNELSRSHDPAGRARDQGIGVFPNPAQDKLNVTFSVLEDNPAELTITNAEGKEIFRKTYDKKGQVSEVVLLKNEKKGLHVISLSDNNRSISRKIIIE